VVPLPGFANVREPLIQYRQPSLREELGIDSNEAAADRKVSYDAALYVSQFAKLYDSMRRSGRSVKDAVVVARQDLRYRAVI
jgi:hypothetical protein